MWKPRASQPGTCALARSRQDPHAFAEFYEANVNRVLMFMTRRVLDPEIAWDLTAETFAKALQARTQFRGQTVDQEQAWLFAIAHSYLKGYWRRGRVERAALQRLQTDDEFRLTDDEIERIVQRAGLDELVQAARSALARLPDDQRTAIQMRVIDEQTYPDIARALGVTEDVVRARVSRGVRTLSRSLHALHDRLENVA